MNKRKKILLLKGLIILLISAWILYPAYVGLMNWTSYVNKATHVGLTVIAITLIIKWIYDWKTAQKSE